MRKNDFHGKCYWESGDKKQLKFDEYRDSRSF
jgi:hypothetical protein